MKLLYLIGQPGSGKTTLLRAALEGCSCEELLKPFAMRAYPTAAQAAGYQLGGDRKQFAGTDTLSLGVQPLAEKWLAENTAEFVVAEGDRLGNHKFFKCAKNLGYDLTVSFLSTPNEIAESRRLERGSHQAQQWIDGRITKITKLRGWYNPRWILDGCASVEELSCVLRKHPVIAGIREACGVRG